MWQHILFDLDGTLTDPAEGICGSVRHAMQALGHPVPEQKVLERFIGPPLNESFAEVCGFDEAQTEKAILAFREYFEQHGLAQNEIFPGIPELLKALADDGRSLYIATTKPTYLATQVLAGFGIEGYFKLVCGSGRGHAGRPKAEVVGEVLQAAAIPPAQAVMVGDRKYDVIGAAAHGLPSVGVLFGYGGRQELTQAGATHLAATVPELQHILLTH